MVDAGQKLIRKALEARLLPTLTDLGFVRLPLEGEDRRSPEIAACFPFGRLRRQRGDGFDQVEIQLHRHRPTAFRLNLGRVPLTGIRHPHGDVSAEDAWVHYLDRYWTMYRYPAMRVWFGPSWLSWRQPLERPIEKAVAAAAACVPEVEALFVSGVRGPHLRYVEAYDVAG